MIGAGNGQNKQDRANRSGRSRFGCWLALVFALVVFAFFMRGDFEASVILLDDLWDGESRQFVTGEYAAAIPARDMLAFCDLQMGRECVEVTGMSVELQFGVGVWSFNINIAKIAACRGFSQHSCHLGRYASRPS